MRLSAKGYAEMVSLIDADIAVLEGGYAVQSALPYTNMSILLTMAGYDGKKVTEPIPDPRRNVSETQRRTEIEKLNILADEINFKRTTRPPIESMGVKLVKGYFERKRRLFYDNHPLDSSRSKIWPPQINETRHEFLKDCLNCPGVLVIKTSSDLVRESYFAQLPHEPCEKCLQIAKDVWSKTVPFFI
jgi:hypothetical protein